MRGSVYFARVGRYIKVGHSENPERRVANLFKSETRYNAPRDIDPKTTPRELIGYVPGTLNDEQAAHAALGEFCVWSEWFVDELEVRDYIRRCLAADDIATELVARPAGDYWWEEDPILHNDEDRAQGRLAADAISAALAKALTA